VVVSYRYGGGGGGGSRVVVWWWSCRGVIVVLYRHRGVASPGCGMVRCPSLSLVVRYRCIDATSLTATWPLVLV
jgi:hypothetical protein